MLDCLVCGALGFAFGGVVGLLLMALLYYGKSDDD